VIDVNGLHPCKDKLRVMKDAPRSKDLAFKVYTNPFNSSGTFKYMDKGGCRWRWTNTEEQAFVDAKTLLLESRVLLCYDDGLPLFLCCDA